MYTAVMVALIGLGGWLAVSGGLHRRAIRTAAGVLLERLEATLQDLSEAVVSSSDAGGRDAAAAGPNAAALQ